jgi:drug/metabolite transporter (DMT)-like permease
MVFAHAMLHDERMTRVKVGALALGIGGVAVVFLDQMHFAGGAAFAGSFAVVAGAMFVAFAYVSMRRWGQALDPTVITAGQMAAAIVPLTAYAAIVEGNPLATGWTWRAAGAVLYLALFGSVAAGWLNYWLLKRIGATRLLVMSLVQPLVAVLLGALVLGERPTLRAGIGGLLILIGTSLALGLIRFESRIPNP